jgi:hypothetical protein
MGRKLLICSFLMLYLLTDLGCAASQSKASGDYSKIPPKSAFEKVKYGSSYEEVEKELGQNGLLISESQNEKFTRQIYRWGDGKTPCRVYLTFRNGKLTYKKYSGSCD